MAGGSAATTIGAKNPIRYRGYYYDVETKFYYLQSRYYDPEICRFINADGQLNVQDGLLGNNLFTYCNNNPIVHSDSTGQWFGIDDLIAGFVGAVVGVTSQLVSDLVTSAVTGSWNFSSWETYVGAGTGGAIGGITTLYAGPVVGAAVGAGISTLVGQTLENVTGKTTRSAGEIVINATLDAAIGALTGRFISLEMPGITSGCNSMQAVYRSGLTKLGNLTASKMSAKVIGKGIVSGVGSDFSRAICMGIEKSFFESLQSYKNGQPISLASPLYWCAS